MNNSLVEMRNWAILTFNFWPLVSRQKCFGEIGLMDTICPPSTQFAVYNKIVSPKKMVIYPDFDHEPLPSFQDQAFQFFMKLKI